MKGTVYQRDKVWAVSYYTGIKVNGKYERIYKSGFKSKREAEKYLRERLTEIDNGIRIQGSNILLKHYLVDWLEVYSKTTNMALNTYKGYKVNINKHIIPVIGDIKLNKLEAYHIEDLICKMIDKGLARTSQRYVIATLRKALNYAVKRSYIGFNVIDRIDIPKPQKYTPVVLSTEQMKILCDECLKDYNYIPILLSAVLGLRRGEVLGLKWSDFDFDGCTVHIQRTATPRNGGYDFSPCKTDDSNRILAVPEFVIQYLKKWLCEQDSVKQYISNFNIENFVFYLPNGIISATTLNRRLKKLLNDCSLPNIRFHDLRHSWATMIITNNIPTKIASSMLGHSNTRTTLDIYTHIAPDSQKPAIEVLNSIFTDENSSFAVVDI